MNCPAKELLLEFLEGRPGQEASSLDLHIAQCPRCQQTLERLLGEKLPPTTGNFNDSDIRRCVERIAAKVPTDDEIQQLIFDPSSFVPEEFEFLEYIGRGGMCMVFKVRLKALKQVKALKMLLPEFREREDRRSRFHKEMAVLGQLQHPNIVQASYAEKEPIPYLLMEYLEGEDLQQLVKRQGILPIPEACRYIREAATGLAYAHQLPSCPIIHRDIKPSNLFLAKTREGCVVKILDLGLAKYHRASQNMAPHQVQDGELTVPGLILGTPNYMAPEQADGKSEVDHRADVYSLGCTFYFLLIGEPPYRGTRLDLVMVSHREATIPRVCDARSEVPAELSTNIERMMAKRPEDRPQSMSEVIDILERWDQPQTFPTKNKADQQTPSNVLHDQTPPARPWSRVYRAMALCFVVVLSLLWWMFSISRPREAAKPESL
jgi:serine/threonine protein kinase